MKVRMNTRLVSANTQSKRMPIADQTEHTGHMEGTQSGTGEPIPLLNGAPLVVVTPSLSNMFDDHSAPPSPQAVDLDTLISDIRGQYTINDLSSLVSPLSREESSDDTCTTSSMDKITEGIVSLSEPNILDYKVTLSTLKKGSHKRGMKSKPSSTTTSKLPYVLGPVFRTRSHQKIGGGWPGLPIPLKPLDIVRKFSGNPSRTSDFKVPKYLMSTYHKLLFVFVMKNLVPYQQRRDAASFLDLTLMELLDREMKINLLGLMISYLTKVAFDVKQNHSLLYGFLLTRVFDKMGIHFGTSAPQFVGFGTDPSVASMDMAKVLLENECLQLENVALHNQMVKNEEVVAACHNVLVTLIQGLSHSVNPPSCLVEPSSSPAPVDPFI
ncbi:hypothetical protein HAX54_005769 [Datura stramonium]|uniref:Uncharacterized protein n=1 Tax=Datura stramonium TaxID=4076 RepID=A0ABS8T9A7_DATST|nr:hypothetical protein [Datura stramonium]